MRVPLGWVFGGGYNLHGETGTDTGQVQDPAMMSVAIPDLDRVIALAAGSFHSLALGADGTVWAWGLWQGTQGAGQKVPVKVAGLDSMIAEIGRASWRERRAG